MIQPKLAMCNHIDDPQELRRMALAHGFDGVDWTLTLDDLSPNGRDDGRLQSKVSLLEPLEVRFHCAYPGVDLGDEDPAKSHEAMQIFRRSCRLVSRLGGRFMTVHLGLGRDTTNGLSWQRTNRALAELVSYGKHLGVCVCLENLAFGWSSRPELFEKLIRSSGAGITLDIGHGRVSPSVQSQRFDFEDFITPHQDRVYNAHIYHEETEAGHIPPECLEDLSDRLRLLSHLPCDWWVLELRNSPDLIQTLAVVRQYLSGEAGDRSRD